MRALMAQALVTTALAGTHIPAFAAFEVLLGVEAWECAALSLLGDDCGYMLSRGIDGQHLASVILPGRAEEAIASADTAALAIIAALALALNDAPLRFGDVAETPSRPAMRFN